MTAYIIDWSSLGQAPAVTGKTSFSLAERTTDTTTTSLALTGKGVYDYGRIQQENFIKLLENFASQNPPANPTVGQIWFSTSESILYTCIDNAFTSWTGAVPTKYHTSGTHSWIRVGNTSSSDIAAALGYVPYNPTTNIANYITSAQAPVQSVAGRTGTVVLTSADITNFSTAVSSVAPVASVAGRIGAVVLAQADISGLTITSAPTFSQVTVAQATIRGFKPPVVNPTAGQVDGDIQVSGSLVNIWANGGWKQIFPAVYS